MLTKTCSSNWFLANGVLKQAEGQGGDVCMIKCCNGKAVVLYDTNELWIDRRNRRPILCEPKVLLPQPEVPTLPLERGLNRGAHCVCQGRR